MALWGKTDTDTDSAKPKFAKTGSPIDPKNVFASSDGWVQEITYTDSNGSDRVKRELLVCIADLDGGDVTDVNLGAATISGIEFLTDSISVGDDLTLIVKYNEKVTVTGTPQVTIDSANTGADTVPTTLVLSYASGSSTNKLKFTATSYGNAASYTVGAATIDLNTGTIVDKGTTVDSDLTIPVEYTGANSEIGTVTAS